MKSKFELKTMRRMLDILTVDKDEFTVVDIMHNTFMNKVNIKETVNLLYKNNFIKYKKKTGNEKGSFNDVTFLTDKGKELKQDLIQIFYHYQKVLDLFNSE